MTMLPGERRRAAPSGAMGHGLMVLKGPANGLRPKEFGVVESADRAWTSRVVTQLSPWSGVLIDAGPRPR
jgi:hypothetical protein